MPYACAISLGGGGVAVEPLQLVSRGASEGGPGVPIVARTASVTRLAGGEMAFSRVKKGDSEYRELCDASVDAIQHHGGSFGVYMANKITKLRDQFGTVQDEIRESNIFQGVVVYLNGRTEPPHEELRDLLHRHGGVVEGYQTKEVTHIICAEIPDSKVPWGRGCMARGACVRIL